ncbi:hypothetical protein RDWZM_007651 [Blomia tropicalis]|uniref:Uncharacterized protein n=1 Tax=Blomia tropicalis TaxID=40697 RepID=A0A9Q0LZV6_BLOTA|nr:hypothetical protein RDWZM_007651 [Blomia tropicalis]
MKYYQKIEKLPGPYCGINPIGNINLIINSNLDLLTCFFDTICGLSQIYYPSHSIVRFWISYKPMKVFSSTVNVHKSNAYIFMRPFLGTGLVTSSGKKWSQRRKMITPTFHFNILEAFLPSMNEQANILIDKIQEQLQKSNQESIVLDVVPYITYATLDIICETAMGIKLGSQFNPTIDYVQSIHRIVNKLIKRTFSPWLWNNFIYYNLTATGREDRSDLKIAHEFTMKVIKDRKSEAIQQLNEKQFNNESKGDNFVSSRRRLAFLDMLIEQHLKDPNTLNLDGIREEVDTFMFEGHDTTSISLIWTLLLLGHHPEIQEKVHQELDDIWERYNLDESKQLTSNQLREMKLMEACIKESLRLYPSLPFIGRVSRADIELDNFVIPKGTILVLLIHMIHRDPKIYPKPHSFIPDRFIEGTESFVKNPFAYVPFSAGPRNCIGQKFALQEEKIILAFILRHFRLESIKHFDNILKHPEIVLRPKEPINIRFIPRQQIKSTQPKLYN